MMGSVLFVCNQNSVRSPMAAMLVAASAGDRVRVDSAGVFEGAPDPFLPSVMAEIGISDPIAPPKSLDDLDLTTFDLIVALTAEARDALDKRGAGERTELWETTNPSQTYGSRDQILGAYRAVRDELKTRIVERFTPAA